ncbi:hypothetical protein IWX87_002036 [Polaromonas sp. CG_9.7]|uniref:hypothetical protein n=1 Tax=Polaromonas sp. CG_23.6 TaxID=2760709 RepID=UPI0018CA3288|nr:hypothetical protein [Polaromonas sp. CG_9.7]MBG6114294.1 hypothetical protein [Polaromonas sp. CG_9.2]MDH6182747.1 hypothetical protein [Polaromonas sp. CG_23.6]
MSKTLRLAEKWRQRGLWGALVFASTALRNSIKAAYVAHGDADDSLEQALNADWRRVELRSFFCTGSRLR